MSSGSLEHAIAAFDLVYGARSVRPAGVARRMPLCSFNQRVLARSFDRLFAGRAAVGVALAAAIARCHAQFFAAAGVANYFAGAGGAAASSGVSATVQMRFRMSSPR
jgi:hypothetical protein